MPHQCGAHRSPSLPLPSTSPICRPVASQPTFPSLAPFSLTPTPLPGSVLFWLLLIIFCENFHCHILGLPCYSAWSRLLFLTPADSLGWGGDWSAYSAPHCLSWTIVPPAGASRFPWMTPQCSLLQRLKSNSFPESVHGGYLYTLCPLPPQPPCSDTLSSAQTILWLCN